MRYSGAGKLFRNVSVSRSYMCLYGATARILWSRLFFELIGGIGCEPLCVAQVRGCIINSLPADLSLFLAPSEVCPSVFDAATLRSCEAIPRTCTCTCIFAVPRHSNKFSPNYSTGTKNLQRFSQFSSLRLHL